MLEHPLCADQSTNYASEWLGVFYMVKKLTIEYIREQFRDRRNWELREEVYYNNAQKLRYWCNDGQHEHAISWANFAKNVSCGACASNKPLTLEFISEECRKYNLKVLSTEYAGCGSNLQCECSKEHRFWRNWDTLKNNKTCPICTGARNSLEGLQGILESIQWKLCEEKYLGNRSLINVECPLGHPTKKRTHEIKNAPTKGLICGACNPPGKKRLSIESLRDGCLSYGFEMVSDEYHGSSVPFEVKCLVAGHKTLKTWDNIKGKKGCITCSGLEKLTIEYVREQFCDRRNWTLLSEKYEGPHKKLKFYCNDGGHLHAISWNAFQSGIACAKCSYPVKTKEQIASQRIAKNLVGGFAKALKDVGRSRFRSSKTKFCNDLAIQVIQTLGKRPTHLKGIRTKFEIDHILPQSWFNHNIDEQVVFCWNIKNLQWLPKKENSEKNNRLSRKMMLQLTPYQVAVANLAEFRPKGQEVLMKKLGLWMTPEDARKQLKKHSLVQGCAIQLEIPLEQPIAS